MVIAVLNGRRPTFIHNTAKAQNCTYLGCEQWQVKMQESIQEKKKIQKNIAVLKECKSFVFHL